MRKKMDNQIMVSICCTAYNHEKYIRRTLDGFVNQKTNFKYEVIIHDDASPDKTAEIIKEYEEKYPDIVHGIYQTENQYSKNVKIIEKFIAPKTKGKYVALCEGDDYWTDTSKLQRQVDALEENKDCFFCVHKVLEVSEDERSTGNAYPTVECKEGKIQPDEFLMMGQNYQFQTSSYLFNGDQWRAYNKNPPEYKRICLVGDETYMLRFASLGPIYYIDRVMSCYRRGVPTSWSEQQKRGNHIQNVCTNAENMVRTLQAYDRATNERFHDICLLRESQQMYMQLMLEGKTGKLLQSENREIFGKLTLKRKITAAVACCNPSIVRTMYCKKLFGER